MWLNRSHVIFRRTLMGFKQRRLASSLLRYRHLAVL
jgi:hypothetical protein